MLLRVIDILVSHEYMTLYQTEQTTFPRKVTWCYVLMVNPHSICPKYHGLFKHEALLCTNRNSLNMSCCLFLVWFALVGTR